MIARFNEISNTSIDNDTTIIVINGFLSENNQDIKDWMDAIPKYYQKNRIFHLEWEASNISKNLYKLARNKIAFTATTSFIPVVGWLNAAKTGTDIVSIVGEWKKSINKTIDAGAELAKFIDTEDRGGRDYIIMGHSLGARVAYHGLSKVNNISRVKSVCLLGGAVSVNEAWKAILDRNPNMELCNLFSSNDSVLKYLYKAGSGLSNIPIGRSAIDDIRVKNWDVSHIVSGHMKYKKVDIGDYLFSRSFGK